MVISPANSRLGLTALTKRVGLMDRPDSPDGELIKYMWDDPFMIPANMTLEVSELFSRELTRYIEETEEIAMSGLKVNRHILDMITNELLENSRITGLVNEYVFFSHSPFFLMCTKDGKDGRWEKGWKEKGRIYSLVREAKFCFSSVYIGCWTNNGSFSFHVVLQVC
ncbi:unnamed protein product, partial [Vitis vinifera]